MQQRKCAEVNGLRWGGGGRKKIKRDRVLQPPGVKHEWGRLLLLTLSDSPSHPLRLKYKLISVGSTSRVRSNKKTTPWNSRGMCGCTTALGFFPRNTFSTSLTVLLHNSGSLSSTLPTSYPLVACVKSLYGVKFSSSFSYRSLPLQLSTFFIFIFYNEQLDTIFLIFYPRQHFLSLKLWLREKIEEKSRTMKQASNDNYASSGAYLWCCVYICR